MLELTESPRIVERIFWDEEYTLLTLHYYIIIIVLHYYVFHWVIVRMKMSLERKEHGGGQSEKGILSCTSKDCNSRTQTIHIWMIF